jgi:hypothetical protein
MLEPFFMVKFDDQEITNQLRLAKFRSWNEVSVHIVM